MSTSTDAATGSRMNISRWALEHPALTRYLMVVLMLLGFAAYFQLGQDEDPPFTFRAMVVQAFWPGASAQQVAEQVTDKIEKALQEVPQADKIRSYTKPGESVTIFQLKDSAPPKEVAASWYQARKRVGDMRGTLAAGRHRPGLQRRLRRRLRLDLCALGRRLQPRRVARARRSRAPAAAARARCRQGRGVRRAGREAVHRDLAKAPGAAGPGHEPGDCPARRAKRRRRRRCAQRRQREPAGACRGPVQFGRRTQALPDPRHQRGHRCGQHDQALRHRRCAPRLRRPADDQGAPPGPGRGGAGRVDGQGWRHHRAGPRAASSGQAAQE